METLSVKAKEAYENLCMHKEENIRSPTQGNFNIARLAMTLIYTKRRDRFESVGYFFHENV